MKSSKSTYFKLNLYKTNKPVGSLAVDIMDVAVKEDRFFVSAAKIWNSNTRTPL